jgi:hypothetical protein
MRTPTLAIVAALLAVLVGFLDISDTAIAVGGFVVFLIIQFSSTPPQKKSRCHEAVKPSPENVKPQLIRGPTKQERIEKNKHKLPVPPPAATSKPIDAVVLAGSQWDDQVSEFLLQLTPAEEAAHLVSAITSSVEGALRKSIPHADVVGFCQGNPKTSRAFAKAVPEIEIVLNIDDYELRQLMGKKYYHTDTSILHKVALRAFTDQLASVGDFQFRRSTFKNGEPMVVLIPPETIEKTPFSFSVNAQTPASHDAVLRACLACDPRARQLVLLVQRWARDRGISHAAKGNLPPYAWTLLVIFFLQIRATGEGALLTAVESAIPRWHSATPTIPLQTSGSHQTGVGALLKEFFEFYASKFDLDSGCADVRHINQSTSERHHVPWRKSVLRIVDPYMPSLSVAGVLTNEGRVRLREEVARAHTVCCANGTVPQLFEIWNPETSPEPADQGRQLYTQPTASAKGSLTASPTSLRPQGRL